MSGPSGVRGGNALGRRNDMRATAGARGGQEHSGGTRNHGIGIDQQRQGHPHRQPEFHGAMLRVAAESLVQGTSRNFSSADKRLHSQVSEHVPREPSSAPGGTESIRTAVPAPRRWSLPNGTMTAPPAHPMTPSPSAVSGAAIGMQTWGPEAQPNHDQVPPTNPLPDASGTA